MVIIRGKVVGRREFREGQREINGDGRKLIQSGEHTIQCASDVLQNCTPEIYIILSTNVTPIHSLKMKKRNEAKVSQKSLSHWRASCFHYPRFKVTESCLLCKLPRRMHLDHWNDAGPRFQCTFCKACSSMLFHGDRDGNICGMEMKNRSC